MAYHIQSDVIPYYLDKLIAEGMLKGSRKEPGITVKGNHLLSEFWLAQSRTKKQVLYVQTDDLLFRTSSFSRNLEYQFKDEYEQMNNFE